MNKENVFYATGKRKTAIARTWLKPGNGEIIVNDRPVNDYFKYESARTLAIQPFKITNTSGSYDVKIHVMGGGIAGQAGAVRHGITRALLQVNPDFRQVLKKAGFVKRDPRRKERKKYGQRGARARFQFSKR
ncbi:MAG TPA: 30S ribosomal protein S9 [Desulfobacterales bacterium]|nr:30S ribosomal protein S9 [Desulfobacterales bacterium]